MTASTDNKLAKALVCKAFPDMTVKGVGTSGFVLDKEGKRYGVAMTNYGDWKLRQFYVDSYQSTFFLVCRDNNDVYKCTVDNVAEKSNRISETLGKAFTVTCEKPVKV